MAGRRASARAQHPLTPAELRAHQEHGITAIRAVDDRQSVVDQVRPLGRLQHEPAVPTLIALWEECGPLFADECLASEAGVTAAGPSRPWRSGAAATRPR